MEKRQSRSLTKPIPPVDGKLNSGMPTLKLRESSKPDKPSREDISRCINIWAHMYRLRDASSEARELCLPSRPWTGRNPNSIKRFE